MTKRNRLRVTVGIFGVLLGIGTAQAIWQCQCSKGDMTASVGGDGVFVMSCSSGGTVVCTRP
jgi:hypothetical protein